MSNNVGTLVGSPIRPYSEFDVFPSAFANEIKGGYHCYPDIASRDAITPERRQKGMVVYVESTLTEYRLGGDLSNAYWEVDTASDVQIAACVIIRPEYGAATFIRPTMNSGAGRMAALVFALTLANVSPLVNFSIQLIGGEFLITTGHGLHTYCNTGKAKLDITSGAELIYANENDAQGDHIFFRDQVRYSDWFGIKRIADGFGSFVDMQPRIMACLFSMQDNHDSGEPTEYCAAYPSMIQRKGRMYLTAREDIPIKKTIWLTGTQQIYGEGGKQSRIDAMPGMAPSNLSGLFADSMSVTGVPADISMIRVLRNTTSDGPLANYTYDVHIVNITIFNVFRNNVKLTGLRYGCAQGGELDKLVISGMSQYGLDIMDNAGPFNAGQVFVIDFLNHQMAPQIKARGLNSTNFSLLDAEICNFCTVNSTTGALIRYNTAGYKRNWNWSTYNDDLPAIYFENCKNITIGLIYNENLSTGTVARDCVSFRIGGIDCMRSNVVGVGKTLLSFIGDNIGACEVGGIVGKFFDKLLYITTFGYNTSEAGNQSGDGFAMSAGMNTRQRCAFSEQAALDIIRQNDEAVFPAYKNYSFRNLGSKEHSALVVLGGEGQKFIKWQHTAEYGNEITEGWTTVVDPDKSGTTSAAGGLWSGTRIYSEKGYGIPTYASSPTTTQISSGCSQIVHNSTLGEIRLWVNVNGVLFRSAPLTLA